MNPIKALLEPYLLPIRPWIPVIKLVGFLTLCLALFVGGCRHGQSNIKEKAATDKVRIVYKQGKVTEKVVTKYVDRIQTIRVKGDEIIKEIPVYVTPENDAACTINNGFVRLWNDANQGAVSDAAPGTDAAPAEVSLSDVGQQKAIESRVCHETEAKLEALQEWVRAQSKVK